MSRLLALDLGTRTGWAMDAASGAILSGYADFKPSRYDGGGMRYLRFRRWLDAMHAEHGFGEIAYEEVRRHKGVDAAHVYGGLLATLTAWAEEHNVPAGGIGVGTIKRSATGNGRADKQDMMAAATDLVGRAIKDDNEADAICILTCRRREIGHV